jgi:prepilin-type N-terminal cleavage/methylation domain-containing protein
MERESGFTIIELIVTFVVLAVLAGIAIPTFSVWLPNYHLKSAAMDIYANFQQAKMMAIRTNRLHGVEFDPAQQLYRILDCGEDNSCASTADNDTVRTVRFSEYDEDGGIRLGKGDAISAMGAGFGNYVTYSSPVDTATFNPRGLSNAGYVYIENTKGTAYALGTFTSGMIVMRKWESGGWK